MRNRSLLGVAAALASLVGCGIVTEIEDGTKADGSAGQAGSAGAGAGGASGASSGGSAGQAGGGSAGSGGSLSPACNQLARIGDPMMVTGAGPSPGSDDQSPQLVALGSRVSMIYENAGAGELRHASWDTPWSSWGPATLSAAIIPTTKLASRFAAAPDTHSSWPVALHQVSGTCLRLTRAPNDTLAEIGACEALPAGSHQPSTIIFGPTALDSETYVVGFDTDPNQLSFARVSLGKSGSPGTVSAPDPLGCATAAVFAGGWYSPTDGFIAAFSTSRPFRGCQLDLYTDGPPTRLQIVAFGKEIDAFNSELRHELTLFPIVHLRVAPRSDGGAWIVFQTDGGETPGPIQALAVDSSGKPTSEIVSIADVAQVEKFEVAPLGNRAIVLWHSLSNCDAPPCDQLSFKVFDESTLITAPPTHIEPVVPMVHLSLVSSPDAKSVIAAWSDAKAMPSDIWAARFDCVP